MTDIALLPCPFCSGEASPDGTVRYGESHAKEQGWNQTEFYYCNCMQCGANNKDIIGHKTRSDAIAAWNRRTFPSQVAPQPANPAQVTDALERVARMSFGYELMFEALCHIAGTSGGSTSWYTRKAQEITARVSPLHSLTADSNPEKPGDCKSQHLDFMRDFRAAIGAGGPAVKPLKWRGDKAECPFGDYTVDLDEDDDMAESPWCCWTPIENLGHFATTEEAKAAAQADYEHRILSALSQRILDVSRTALNIVDIGDDEL